jgi:hypothetical protein
MRKMTEYWPLETALVGGRLKDKVIEGENYCGISVILLSVYLPPKN